MAESRAIDVLNRLLELEYRSLPMYLEGTSPWMKAGEERAAEVLKHLVTDQKEIAGRIAKMIFDRGGRVEIGGFPMEFTDLHMLSLDFLVHECIDWQKQAIAEIEGLIGQLQRDHQARALAEEALGLARGHLENLEETAKELV